jgi:hypothetical protein
LKRGYCCRPAVEEVTEIVEAEASTEAPAEENNEETQA